MTKLIDRRIRIGTQISLCSFCCLLSGPQPQDACVNQSSCQMICVCVSLCPLLLCIPYSFYISPALLSCFITGFILLLVFFFSCLNDGGSINQFFDFELWQLSTLLEKSLLLCISHLAWHQSWKRLLMMVWTFLVCKFIMAQMTLFSVIEFLSIHFYHCLLNMSKWNILI